MTLRSMIAYAGATWDWHRLHYDPAFVAAQRYDLTTRTSTVKMALHLLGSVVVLALGFEIFGLMVALALGTVVSCLMQRARAREILGAAAVPPRVDEQRYIRGFVASLTVVNVLDALVRDRSEIFFLRLFTGPVPEFEDRAHFLGIAARVMRQVVDRLNRQIPS